MTAIGMVQAGQFGLQAGLEQAQRAALNITQTGTSNDGNRSELASITESSVDLLQAKLQTQASAKVLNTADQMLGSLIDTYS